MYIGLEWRSMAEQQYEIIDNFLPSDAFKKLHDFLLPSDVKFEGTTIGWGYVPKVISKNKKGTEDWRLFYLAHLVYDHIPLSPLFNPIMTYCNELLDIKSLIRIKINLYPNTEIVKEHGMHTDYDFSHKAAILYINTCDGYTKLEDGTKIESVANRMLLFDGSKLHTPSTCTDQSVRMNINFNYF